MKYLTICANASTKKNGYYPTIEDAIRLTDEARKATASKNKGDNK